ncbi:MAG: serine protein kinase PrkA [Desulfobacterales bacterium]|jgi:predicted Ser/Thr protein kinase|nr:serine protein kinase PrkA [Desulfobacterales bacterium]
MENLRQAMNILNTAVRECDQRALVSFDEFLKMTMAEPARYIRNVFQLFHDMVINYVDEEGDEYPDDPESIHYVRLNCNRLFVDNADRPFFADRLFANRLVSHIEAMRRGAQQNKLYIFEGPHGCGKSTFLNNLLMKFEEYANTENGMRYETVWRVDRQLVEGPQQDQIIDAFITGRIKPTQVTDSPARTEPPPFMMSDFIEIPCVSHDNPLLMIPKSIRRPFFDELFKNDEFKWKLFTEKEYEWVFRDSACTICSSLYQALLTRLKSPQRVFQRVYARPYQFNRRLGEGISVFNPGDKPLRRTTLTNQMIQTQINDILKDSNLVQYLFSHYAKTNNGIYVLMDIKSNNTERLIQLHNVISEGVHKVEDLEENVNSLFIALMNPEDKANIKDFPSFSDRIEYIKIPYVMDLNTEVEIYRNIFGKHIDQGFLPRVLHNFARVIISTRLNLKSEALQEWIGDPAKYKNYCDENLLLLKMEIYTGYIPSWLSEEDRKNLTARRRRSIIGESETEGIKGISGRDSIKIFNDFYSRYAKEDRLIHMATLTKYFNGLIEKQHLPIPRGFLESLEQLYNYTVLQEVKEALYFYNEEQISKDVQNYIFFVNFEPGTTATCQFTKDKINITEEFFSGIEHRLLGASGADRNRKDFRKRTQKEYTTKTLPHDILIEGKNLTETDLYRELHERYIHNLKEKVLEPFLGNENFRRAIADYETEDFKTYDQRIRDDVNYLMNNLIGKYRYTQLGAKAVCMYVIDNDLAKKFASN